MVIFHGKLLNNQMVILNIDYHLVMTNSLLLKIAIERVDFPLKMVIFNSYVSLPEGMIRK